jgi:hypothetical protein
MKNGYYFNEDFKIQLNKSSNQIYLKEPTSTDIIKNGLNQNKFIQICINST